VAFRIHTRSIVFKTFVSYLFITIINVSIFVLMVFENQLDMIAENAVLQAQHKASNLHTKIQRIVGEDSQIERSTISDIFREAQALGISNVTLFDETGKVYANLVDQQIQGRSDASIEELKMINMAITKRGFEDKLYYHEIDKKNNTVSLYVPFTFQGDKIGVVAMLLTMKSIEQQMGYLYRQCALIGVLVILVHALFGFFFLKTVLIPLRKLTEATRQIATGDLEVRVPIVGEDELGLLASSFNEMSVALKNMSDEAKGANPLTGLPGNISIARHIDDCLKASKAICVLYCDLDNFKAYNDKYGFTKGDEAILYTKNTLLEVSKKVPMGEIFVGHEGGDDFVVVCDYDSWEKYAETFVTSFDRGIYQFYNAADARNGFIESINRQGQRQRFPLMSISIAVVSNRVRPFQRHAEMIQVAAELKKYVKSMDGSCYAIDRRQGPVNQNQGRLQQMNSQGPHPSAPGSAPQPVHQQTTAPQNMPPQGNQQQVPQQQPRANWQQPAAPPHAQAPYTHTQHAGGQQVSPVQNPQPMQQHAPYNAQQAPPQRQQQHVSSSDQGNPNGVEPAAQAPNAQVRRTPGVQRPVRRIPPSQRRR